jgi:FkbM family methyltransferase
MPAILRKDIAPLSGGGWPRRVDQIENQRSTVRETCKARGGSNSFEDCCRGFLVSFGSIVWYVRLRAFSIACSNFDIKQIYAFEPHPELSQYLNDNLNRYGKNTKVFNNAISSEFKKVRFGTTESTVASRIRNEGEFEVDAINLEKFVIDNNLELPTYLKIDIEGAEYEFFENTSDNFFKNVRSIFFEFHCNDGVNLLKIIDRFKNLGYKLSHKDNALDHNLSHMNTVYLNK